MPGARPTARAASVLLGAEGRGVQVWQEVLPTSRTVCHGGPDRPGARIGTGPDGHFTVPRLQALDSARPFMRNGVLAMPGLMLRFDDRSLDLNPTPRETEDLVAFLRTP